MWDGVSESLLARPAFDVADRTFAWRDVLLAASAWGVWGECERAASEGLARLEAGEGAGDEEVRARERAFRRERGLLSAEELEAWLERWQLDRHDWRGYLRAEALRERASAHGERAPEARDAGEAQGAPRAVDLGRATWAVAVCSGALEGALERLAAVAASSSAHGALPAARPPAEGTIAGGGIDEAVLAQMDASHASFCEAALDARAVEREIELRALEWTGFTLRYLQSDEEEVMREAALCVREDGMGIDQVAAEASLEVQRQSTELVALGEVLRGRLLGERPGAILGPLQVGGAWRLVEVLERRTPTLEDPAVRERATRAVVESAVDAEVVNRVRWHERI